MERMAATTRTVTHSLESAAHDDRVKIHPTCVIDPSVNLGENVVIHAYAVIERGVSIGNGTIIQSGCYIGEDCVLGNDCLLHPFVTIREKTTVGSRVVINSGSVIGSDGFGYARESNGSNFKVPQVGKVIIEDDVKIGANSSVDRATLGLTLIKKGVQIGSLVQVGHNVTIGEDSVVGDSVGVCGSCKIGTNVSIGHGVGMVGHIRIGDNAKVKDGSGISKDVDDNSSICGIPAMEEKTFRHFNKYIQQLPDFLKRLRNLEEVISGSKK